MPEGFPDYRDAMPTGRSARAGVVALAVLLAGCAGQVAVTPSTTPATTASTAARPPVADDLTGGTPVQLGSAGHWAISAGRAFTTPEDGTVVALDLASGRTLWQAEFTTGKAWDSRPQLGLSINQSTVIAVRTVNTGAGARLNLLLLDAATGAVLAERLMSDPGRKWSVDLPPKVLAADADTIVLVDDPESGRQTGAVRVHDGRLLWRADEQAVAASAGTVVTRSGGRARGDGKQRWQSAAPLGPLLAQTAEVIVVGMASSAVWLDPALGLEIARIDDLGEAEPPCAATSGVLICLDAGVAGYALANGTQLWASSVPAQSIAIVNNWAYLWRRDGRGDVLDARTGHVLIADAVLPSIRYANGAGILVSDKNGDRWAPLPQ